MFGKSDVEMFMYRIFGDPTTRRQILCRWQSVKTVPGKRLATYFEQFITTLLYEPVSFHMFADRFHVLGETLPIRYEWVSNLDRDTLVNMFAHRQTLFRIRKEYENNQFDFNTFTFEGEKQLINLIWRRQLVRDFAWMVASKNIPCVVLEFIGALQSITLSRSGDVFVSALHDAMQGSSALDEVLAWDHSQSDIHPEILFYSAKDKTH